MPRSLRRYSPATSTFVRTCTQCRQEQAETIENFSYNSNRGIFNSWCRPCVRNHRRNVTTTGPVHTERTFGCEIEFIGNAQAVAREMRNAGLSCTVESYNHRVSHTSWKIVPDASVARGAELVSPVMSGANGFEQLNKASRALRAAGATVSSATGLHVHHDVRNLTVSAFKQLVINWASVQTAVDKMVSASRRNNSYCAPFTSSEVNMITATLDRTSGRTVPQRGFYLGVTRYKNLNLQSYTKYGTVEIRQHQGTTDSKKISAWVKFGQAMINAAVAGTTLDMTSNPGSLLDALELDDTTRSYLKARAEALSDYELESVS